MNNTFKPTKPQQDVIDRLQTLHKENGFINHSLIKQDMDSHGPIVLVKPSKERLDLPLLSATTLHKGGADWATKKKNSAYNGPQKSDS